MEAKYLNKLLKNMDSRIRQFIEEKWREDHYGDVTEEFFDREYQRICDDIEEDLANKYLKRMEQ